MAKSRGAVSKKAAKNSPARGGPRDKNAPAKAAKKPAVSAKKSSPARKPPLKRVAAPSAAKSVPASGGQAKKAAKKAEPKKKASTAKVAPKAKAAKAGKAAKPAAAKPAAKPAAAKPTTKPAAKPAAAKTAAKPAAAKAAAAKAAAAKPAAAKPAAAKPAAAKPAAAKPAKKPGPNGERTALPAEPPRPIATPEGPISAHLDAQLSQQEVEVLYDKLVTERQRVIVGFDRHLSEALGEAQVMPDETDMAQRSTEQAYLIRFADKERKLLSEIEHALEKMKSGEYGVCEGTEEPIGFKRLELRPWTRYSVGYKEQMERERSQHRR
jgi:RNA polymerase-binding protein DksA